MKKLEGHRVPIDLSQQNNIKRIVLVLLLG